MATIKLVCQQCKHAFTVSTLGAIKDRQSVVLSVVLQEVRQTLASFLSNGPLSSPTCGAGPTGGYG